MEILIVWLLGHTYVIYYDVCYLTYFFNLWYFSQIYIGEKGFRSVKSFTVSCL